MSFLRFGSGLLLLLGLAGCNSLFGIAPGEPAETTGGGGGAAPTTSSLGGGGANQGGGGGGAAPECLPERPDECDPALLSDADNCCAQGRSCQGGSCVQGECGKVTVATPMASEQMIDVLVVGDRLFWSTGVGQTLYVKLPNDEQHYVHAVSDDLPNAYVTRLATDGVYVYWTNFASGRISRVAVEGGAVEAVAEVPSALDPDSEAGFGQIAVSAGHVFWTASATGGLWRADLTSVPAEAVLMDDLLQPRGVAVDATHVYWGRNDGSLVRASLTDPTFAPEPVVTGQPQVREIAIIEDRVVWGGYGFIRSALKSGLNALIVNIVQEPLLVEPNAFATDGRDLFFTTSTNNPSQWAGGLYRVPVMGGPLYSLAKAEGTGLMLGATMDCDTVYVMSFDGEELFKLTR